MKEAEDDEYPAEPHCGVDRQAAGDDWPVGFIEPVLFDSEGLVDEVAVDDLHPYPEYDMWETVDTC